jgi:hypothetical protein
VISTQIAWPDGAHLAMAFIFLAIALGVAMIVVLTLECWGEFL